jgi:hypothetical protein
MRNGITAAMIRNMSENALWGFPSISGIPGRLRKTQIRGLPEIRSGGETPQGSLVVFESREPSTIPLAIPTASEVFLQTDDLPPTFLS